MIREKPDSQVLAGHRHRLPADAGIDFLREAAQEQYEDWKNAQK